MVQIFSKNAEGVSKVPTKVFFSSAWRGSRAALLTSILPIALVTGVAQADTPLEQIWYSGTNNSKFLIDFSGDSPKVTCGKPVGQSGGNEGSANFTDPDSGKLRLYTDGMTVFNGQTNQALENGTALGGNSTAGEAAMIVPVVGTNPDLFYIFTNNASSVHFSTADLSKGPNGTVTHKKVLLGTKTGEALGVVPHTNGSDFWVLVFNTAAKLDAYKVDSSGVARLPVTSNTGFTGNIARGSIIHSPDYNTLSLGWAPGRIATAKIDRATGKISDIKERVTGQVGYATAFSPDGTKLYYTNGVQGYSGTPWQIDLKDGSKAQLSLTGAFGGPKLADNGKIYWTGINKSALSVVNNPNAAGTGANFSVDALPLNGCKGAYNQPNQTASSISFIGQSVAGAHKVVVKLGDSIGNINFGNTFIKLGEIGGIKWNDLNGNGVLDKDEPGMAGVTIYLDLNENGALDEGEPRQVTDKDGRYKFSELEPGTYVVREVVPKGYRQTFPGTK
ncbi:MAG: hypothetical protein DRR08_18575 [Candidatus Parabeggiatoa sp. nov. 2]|nr:MAG: hypothetical protein B6247_14835 [Beggiatoa sp. 4572_84]RKZ57587.1 MAG: hypothetical protein DRR08_18575 [Gammaproteobacteria bacterium]HEC83671.1 hypothetical protein [Thioploca sp.]